MAVGFHVSLKKEGWVGGAFNGGFLRGVFSLRGFL